MYSQSYLLFGSSLFCLKRGSGMLSKLLLLLTVVKYPIRKWTNKRL